jgi:ZIP family zinc transporter
MNELLLALAYGTGAGLMIPLGGYLARIERLQTRWLEQEFRHGMMAFGGGILIAAVAFVLVPEGLPLVSLGPGLAAFFGGGVLFALFERLRKRRGGANAQFNAMLTDFVPEAISLGALIASGSADAALLAFFIGAQNLPESFNAFREIMDAGKRRPARVMISFFALAALGPLAVLAGYLFLSDMPMVTGSIMMAAAGGILVLMFQDIAVKAHLKYSQAPSLAALGGFALGIVAMALVGSGAATTF